jgi:hypothetical protein
LVAFERCSEMPGDVASWLVASAIIGRIAGVIGLGGIGGGLDRPSGFEPECITWFIDSGALLCPRGGSGGLFSAGSCGCILDRPCPEVFEFCALLSSTICGSINGLMLVEEVLAGGGPGWN